MVVKAIRIDPKTDAILDVDAQGAFLPEWLRNGHLMPAGGLPVPGGEAVIPVILRAHQYFPPRNRYASVDVHPRGHVSLASSYVGLPAFYKLTRKEVNGWTAQDHKIAPHAKFTLAQLKRYLRKVGSQILWPDHAFEGTSEARLHPALEREDYAHIVYKGRAPDRDSYSAFEDNGGDPTGLEDELRKRGPYKRLFLTGLAEDFCVLWTALAARKLGYEVFVIKDATRPVDMNGSAAEAAVAYRRARVKFIGSDQLRAA